MKKLLLLFFTAILFFSCETTENNAPGFQANIEGIHFKANDSKAIKRTGTNYTIQGITEDKTLTLKIKKPQEGVYLVGGNSQNFATLEDSDGNIYSTNPEGWGEIVISRRNTGQQFFSGTFNFTAILPGQDTLVIDRGVFFEVPYDFNVNDEDEVPNNTEIFVAQVDGNQFNPFTNEAIESNNSIIINSSTSNKSIRLTLPIDAEEIIHNLPSPGYGATYTENGDVEQFESGFIKVITHDITERVIRGNFAFETSSHSITEGLFEVIY